MKRLFYVIVSLLLTSGFAQAQYTRCATYELHKMQLEKDAQYRAYYETIGQQMEKWSSQGAQERTSGTGTIVIPVVVHVLWNTNGQNISDNQIRSQIDVLNEDFN